MAKKDVHIKIIMRNSASQQSLRKLIISPLVDYAEGTKVKDSLSNPENKALAEKAGGRIAQAFQNLKDAYNGTTSTHQRLADKVEKQVITRSHLTLAIVYSIRQGCIKPNEMLDILIKLVEDICDVNLDIPDTCTEPDQDNTYE